MRSNKSNSAAANFLKSAIANSREGSEMTSTMSTKNPLQISQRITSATPSSSSSRMENKSTIIRQRIEYPEKLIDEACIFKASMTSDYSKISELSIIRENITRLDNTLFS